jgi:hypothetical protein
MNAIFRVIEHQQHALAVHRGPEVGQWRSAWRDPEGREDVQGNLYIGHPPFTVKTIQDRVQLDRGGSDSVGRLRSAWRRNYKRIIRLPW